MGRAVTSKQERQFPGQTVSLFLDFYVVCSPSDCMDFLNFLCKPNGLHMRGLAFKKNFSISYHFLIEMHEANLGENHIIVAIIAKP